MARQIITQALDSSEVWTQTLTDADGNVPSPAFSSADVLAATIWPGDDQLAVITLPAPAWTNAAGGVYDLSIPKGSISGLTAGIYRLQVVINPGSNDIVAFDGALELTHAPGSAVAEQVYCSYAQMLRYVPWLQRLQDLDEDQAGFAQQRAEAARWLNRKILQHYRGNLSGLVPTDYSLNHLYWGLRRSLLPQDDMTGYLAAGGLMKTYKGVDLGVIEVVAKYAVGLVCHQQIAPGQGSEYAEFASFYLSWAEERCKTLTVAIDSDGDGVPDIAVDLGSTDLIEA